VSGRPWSETIPKCSFNDKLSLAAEIGRVVALLHTIRTDLEGKPSTWDNFLVHMRKMRARCVNYHTKKNFPPHLLSQIDTFIPQNIDELVTEGLECPSLLHADIHTEHVFLQEENGAR
jgi:hypothetical protein